jgi:tetratricopeptide (TPR) repeat protein
MATSSHAISLENMSAELRNLLSNDQIKQLSQNPNDPESLSMEYKLAVEFFNEGNFQASEELLRHNLVAKKNVLGTTHADTLATMHYLGLSQTELGHFVDGEKTYRELIPLYEKPAASLAARSNLGWVLNKEGKYSEAEVLLTDLLPGLQERFAEDDPRVLGCLRHLMEAVGGQGKFEEAQEVNRRGMELVTKMTGDHQAAELQAMTDVSAQLEQWKNKV